MIRQARLLADRLERISADSTWARRSSGIRGALLRWLSEAEVSSASSHSQMNQNAGEVTRLRSLIEAGYEVLEKAARELVR